MSYIDNDYDLLDDLVPSRNNRRKSGRHRTRDKSNRQLRSANLLNAKKRRGKAKLRSHKADSRKRFSKYKEDVDMEHLIWSKSKTPYLDQVRHANIYFDNRCWDNKNMVIDAIRHWNIDYWDLKSYDNPYYWASYKLKDDDEVITAAKEKILERVSDYPYDISWLQDIRMCRNDRQFMIQAVRCNAGVYRYLPQEIQNDKEFVLEVYRAFSNGSHYISHWDCPDRAFLAFVPLELMTDKDIIVAALQSNIRSLCILPHDIQPDAILWYMMSQNYKSLFEEAREVFKQSESVNHYSKEAADDWLSRPEPDLPYFQWGFIGYS